MAGTTFVYGVIAYI